MDSAGMELMALSWRLAEHPEFASEAQRVREIGAWACVDRPSDLQRSMLAVMGGMMDAMRRRNFVFRDDLPIVSQFEAFLKDVPEPLPGEACYVDPNTLPVTERRDVFKARVEMEDVRHWEADGIQRGIARKARVTPTGGEMEETMVYAEGDFAALVKDGDGWFRLRSTGGALKIEGQEAPA